MKEIEQLDNQQLHDYLAQFDAISAENIHKTTDKECCAPLNIILKQKTFK